MSKNTVYINHPHYVFLGRYYEFNTKDQPRSLLCSNLKDIPHILEKPCSLLR